LKTGCNREIQQVWCCEKWILPTGPRGSGKTFLAEATAGELACRCRGVLASDLISMWMGDTEKRIQRNFKMRDQAPVLLFSMSRLPGDLRQPLVSGGDPNWVRPSFISNPNFGRL